MSKNLCYNFLCYGEEENENILADDFIDSDFLFGGVCGVAKLGGY